MGARWRSGLRRGARIGPSPTSATKAPLASGRTARHLDPSMNRRSLLIRTAALASVLGGAWWARDHLLWPKPQLNFASGGATPWMPYGRQGPAPTVAVRVGGRQIVALIDSGAQYSVIDRALFAELPDAERSLFDMPLVAYGVGGGAQVGRGTALDLELAGLTVSGLRAAILD